MPVSCDPPWGPQWGLDPMERAPWEFKIPIMAAMVHCSFVPSDAEMRAHLEQGNSLFFPGMGREWEKLERQVERLGFGEVYFVSRTKGLRGDCAKVRPTRH